MFRQLSRAISANARARSVRSYSSAVPQYLLNSPATKVTTLSNGLRVASEQTHGETATVGVWIDAGSAYETAETNGVAHFLEHLSFKGTARRSARDIEVQIEHLGASLDAYTAREQTTYWSQCLRDDVPAVLDILSDMLLNSELRPEAVDAERSVILQEKQHVESIAEEIVFDYLHAAAYQGHALARPILGSQRAIETITADDLRSYVQQHYRPHRMVVAGAGGVEHERLVEAAERAFGQLPAGGEHSGVAVSLHEQHSRAAPPFTGSEIRHVDEAMPAAHVAIAFEAVPWAHADYFTFLVIQAMVGSYERGAAAGANASLRLHELLATEQLVHSARAFHTAYNDTGLFGVYIVTEHANADSAVYECQTELVRIARNASDLEVERAKRHLVAQLLAGLDGSYAVCEEIGRQLVALGRRVPPAEIFARVDAITADDVRRVASHHLTDVDPAVAAIGPLINLPDYNQLRGWTYHNRF